MTKNIVWMGTDAVQAGALIVDIQDPDEMGNRETDYPSIAISRVGDIKPLAMLTWSDARELAAALLEVEGIARNG